MHDLSGDIHGHTEKKQDQHQAFLDQIGEGSNLPEDFPGRLQ